MGPEWKPDRPGMFPRLIWMVLISPYGTSGCRRLGMRENLCGMTGGSQQRPPAMLAVENAVECRSAACSGIAGGPVAIKNPLPPGTSFFVFAPPL